MTLWKRELLTYLARISLMGEIRVKIRLENDLDAGLMEQGRLRKSNVRKATVVAVVDTGAVMTLLPQDLVERLGLRMLEKRIVVLANEQRVEMEIAGTVALRIGDRSMRTDCLVGPPGCEPLVGQLVMEALDLIPDPRRKTIGPRPESPFLPTLKLKMAGGASRRWDPCLGVNAGSRQLCACD